MSETTPAYETNDAATVLNKAIDQLIKAHNTQPPTDKPALNGTARSDTDPPSDEQPA